MSQIALFSGMFCSGDTITQQVADQIDYTIAGEHLLEDVATKFGTPVQTLARTMDGSQSFFNALTRDWERSLIYIRATLSELLGIDNQIYHGPAVPLIPIDISHILRVGIFAARDYRMDQARKAGLSHEASVARIEEDNQNLSRWTQRLLSSSPWDPCLFDLTISLPETSVTDAVDLICEALNRNALKPTTNSLQAILDFQLASRVNVELSNNGYHCCTVIARNGALTVVINQNPASPGQLPRALRLLKFERAEAAISKIVATIDGVEKLEIRAGFGFRKTPRILLVDDEREYVSTMSERLQIRNIQSDVAYDGYQALTFVKTDTPDVMVLDLKMPGMDGFEVLQRVRRDYPGIKVIIITGHGSKKDEQSVRELGAYDYLNKPVDLGVLAKKIEEASREASAERTAQLNA